MEETQYRFWGYVRYIMRIIRTKASTRGASKKGKAFERSIVDKILKAFISSGYTDFASLQKSDLIRTPQSGANYEKGDIVKRAEILKRTFPFCIECKANESFPILEELISSVALGKPHSVWWSAWRQANRQAKEMGEMPLLVWKLSRFPVMCAFQYDKWIIVTLFSVFLSHAVNVAVSILSEGGEFNKKLYLRDLSNNFSLGVLCKFKVKS